MFRKRMETRWGRNRDFAEFAAVLEIEPGQIMGSALIPVEPTPGVIVVLYSLQRQPKRVFRALLVRDADGELHLGEPPEEIKDFWNRLRI